MDEHIPGPLDAALAVYPEAHVFIHALAAWIEPDLPPGPERVARWQETEQALAALVAAAERRLQPLSVPQLHQLAGEAQVAFCLDKFPSYDEAFARAIEAAHGIRGAA